ncbi:hypothetical protein, partial [Streptomyces sp. WAC07061]|uniref:hypothetical protein n=1 Tax=Streptomyces sp. WAC07061 TaxID=2487410 RepID=UPI00163D1329
AHAGLGELLAVGEALAGAALALAVDEVLVDHVLRCLAGQAGRTASFADGYDRFTGPTRSAAVSLKRDDVPGRAPADFLAALLSGAPDTRPAQRLREELPGGGLRYAFWLTPQDSGRPRHELYGFTLHPSGSAAGISCSHQDPDGLVWAQRIWRSLAYEGIS